MSLFQYISFIENLQSDNIETILKLNITMAIRVNDQTGPGVTPQTATTASATNPTPGTEDSNRPTGPNVRDLDNDAALQRLRYFAQLSASTIPIVSLDTETTAPSASRDESTRILPEDLIESPAIRIRKKPDRNSIQAEERACEVIQQKILEAQSEIDLIDAEHKSSQGELAQQRQQRLLTTLTTLYRDIDSSIRETTDYDFYKTSLEALKLRRSGIQNRMEELEGTNYDKSEMSNLNRQAIRTNRLLLKVQVMAAGMMLNNRSRLRGGGARNASYMALSGAFTSAQYLKEELHMRALRIIGSDNIRQITTTDWGNENVWSTDLGNLNITVESSSQAETPEPKVTIRQRRWINAHTTLRSIRQHLRRGEIQNAIRKVDMLLDLFKLNRVQVTQSNNTIAQQVQQLRNAIPNDLQEGQPAPEPVQLDITQRVQDLTAAITHPKHWVWMNVEYNDIAAAVRSQLHILTNTSNDYALVLKNKAKLETFAERLKFASRRGRLSERNRTLIEVGIRNMEVWTKRGFVYPKQNATIDLAPAIELISTGFRLEHEETNIPHAKQIYERAAGYLSRSATRLDTRLADMKRVVDGVKTNGNELFAQFRDEDIKRRTNLILEAIEQRNYAQAREQIGAIRGRYFAGEELVDPGYKRAVLDLQKIERHLQRADGATDPVISHQKIEELLNLLIRDIEHKQSFRVLVVRAEDEQYQFRYINPGTTLKGLLNSMARPDTTYIIFGSRIVPSGAERERIELNDASPVIIVAKSKPTKPIKTPSF